MRTRSGRDGPRGVRRGRDGQRRGRDERPRGRSGEHRGRSGEHRGRSGERRGRSGERRGRSGERRGRSGERSGRSEERRGRSGELRGRSALSITTFFLSIWSSGVRFCVDFRGIRGRTFAIVFAIARGLRGERGGTRGDAPRKFKVQMGKSSNRRGPGAGGRGPLWVEESPPPPRGLGTSPVWKRGRCFRIWCFAGLPFALLPLCPLPFATAPLCHSATAPLPPRPTPPHPRRGSDGLTP
jgi:hypothetical protein